MKDNYARTNNICLVFITMVVATMALTYTKTVLLPLIFAIFFYSILTPLVQRIQSKVKLPRALSVLLALLLLWVAMTLIVLIMISSVDNFVQGAPKYQSSIDSAIRFVEQTLTQYNINLELQKIRNLINSLPLFSYAQSLTGQLVSFLGNLFLIFIFTIFMMAGEGGAKNPLFSEILQKISSYISAKFALSVATGTVVWVTLAIFKVELAFIFALITVLLNFIPTIGSIVAVVIPLPIVFLQYQFSGSFFIILALTGLAQFVIGNVIEPKIMGDSMDLHPITVLLCLIFWGLVWGIPGMFLAVPITATLKIIFSRIEATKTLAEILAGRLPQKV